MKKIIFFFYCLLASSLISAQTERIVCNTPNYNNGVTNTLVYNNLQTCLDTANAGDIIYVQGSGVSYGNITITKPLVLIGPGYFLGQNVAPNTQAMMATATLGDVTFTGSGSNSMLRGFVAANIRIQGAAQIIIQNNQFNNLFAKNSGNCIINSNYIMLGLHTWWDEWLNNSGMEISNNVILGSLTAMNAIVENNIINAIYNELMHINFYRCAIRNNIFGSLYSNPYPYNVISESSFQNNIFRGDIFLLNGVNGNKANIGFDDLFVGSNSPSQDGRFVLKMESPAIGAATDGGDCGVFGGSRPYKLSGIAFNPNIHTAVVPNSGTAQGGLQVRIVGKANQ